MKISNKNAFYIYIGKLLFFLWTIQISIKCKKIKPSNHVKDISTLKVRCRQVLWCIPYVTTNHSCGQSHRCKREHIYVCMNLMSHAQKEGAGILAYA